MKSFNLITLSALFLLILGKSQAITCEEVKSILNTEYEKDCCELPQVQCNQTNNEVLSINGVGVVKFDNHLERRKGGGGHGGGHSSSHSSSHSFSSGGHSFSSGGHRSGFSGNAYSSSPSTYMQSQKSNIIYPIVLCIIAFLFGKF
ncbi:hypothetical protein BCR36DRAFT_372639 [Piromyces finnis]|uniref:Hydrophobin n=1 Tax=Piromyces finnis TaxID=1754191 RepID=A0A1Y1V276_9FUNG|nr:hypothetical protein BCR36DRAFT_372639 [Piromyces finnis]|eukprot:ORX45586.1 hypothetical protein BCR36DRAFT_372639 [Piromyces finnis]